MRRLVLGRALLLLSTLVLFLAVGVALFLLARSHYLPSSGQFWNVPGPNGGVFFGATDPQDLAARANVPLLVLVLGAALNSAFLALLAIGSALLLGVPFGFWLAIHAPRRVAEEPGPPRPLRR